VANTTLSSSQIPEQFKSSFVQHANPLRYLTGEIICREGDYDRSMYLITEGLVEVIKKHEHLAEDKTVATLHAGELFGEINFVFGKQRIATIRAAKDTIVYQLSYEQALPLMHNNHQLYSFLHNLGMQHWAHSLILTLDLFSSLPRSSTTQLLKHSQCRIFPSGVHLYSIGEKPERLYILLSGMLEVQHLDDEPIDITCGQCLTPATSLSRGASQWRASTISECIVVTFPITDILKAAASNIYFLDSLKKALLQ
jgi:CRP-like cAMP-binding protein